MNEIAFSALGGRVVWPAFGPGPLFGTTAQRTHFCTTGAITDIVNMGSWNRMWQWLLAMAVAITGVSVLSAAGIIEPAKSFYTAMRLNWLSHLVGGTCFGFDMVLAIGCGNRTLVRIGTVNLKSLIVFIAVGLSAFMTLKGILAIPRTTLLGNHFITLATHEDLPSIVVASGGTLALMQVAIGGAAALGCAIG